MLLLKSYNSILNYLPPPKCHLGYAIIFSLRDIKLKNTNREQTVVSIGTLLYSKDRYIRIYATVTLILFLSIYFLVLLNLTGGSEWEHQKKKTMNKVEKSLVNKSDKNKTKH